MDYHFKNLVFEGGGVKGIAYVGALEILEQRGVLSRVKRLGGTSAGAITALLLALNYTIAEIREILWDMDFRSFMDSSRCFVSNTDRIFRQYGWYKGEFFKAWIGDLIQSKTGNRNITFEELAADKARKELYLIGTNLSTGYAEIFSRQHSPKMTILEAVRISMSLPLFFAAVRNPNRDVYVDGGVLENYPIKLFDKRCFVDQYYVNTEYYDEINNTRRTTASQQYVFNMETLGFRLDSDKEIKVFEGMRLPQSVPINNFFTYIKRLVNTMLDGQQNRHLHSDDWQRTIYIDTLGVKTTDFEISQETKLALVQSGRVGTNNYISWFDNTNDHIANKPRFFYDAID